MYILIWIEILGLLRWNDSKQRSILECGKSAEKEYFQGLKGIKDIQYFG